MHPGTSVIIPVRNGANYIREAMCSVPAQLDQRDELIIVDDGSSDETLSIVLAMADPRMRVLSTTGRGVAAARNAGLAVAAANSLPFSTMTMSGLRAATRPCCACWTKIPRSMPCSAVSASR